MARGFRPLLVGVTRDEAGFFGLEGGGVSFFTGAVVTLGLLVPGGATDFESSVVAMVEAVTRGDAGLKRGEACFRTFAAVAPADFRGLGFFFTAGFSAFGAAPSDGVFKFPVDLCSPRGFGPPVLDSVLGRPGLQPPYHAGRFSLTVDDKNVDRIGGALVVAVAIVCNFVVV